MDIQVATRPVRPDDDERLVRMWPRLSPDTVYRRFHSPLRELPMATVHHLVEVDHDTREAVVAEVGGEVVGVARYDRSPDDPETAEFAVLVEDAWQGVGLGRQLLTELTELAARRGVRTLTAIVQPDNDRMVWLIRRLLPDSRLVRDSGVYAVASPLRVPPTTVGVPAAVPAEHVEHHVEDVEDVEKGALR
jgi:GNAT superfamily N-acetyltransferase